MKVEAVKDNFLCADGKFFVVVGEDDAGNVTYRQIELYLPAAEGCYGEPIVATMDRWMSELVEGKREYRWAIGATGGQLTARYQIRESDGELVSLLALQGGMKI